MARRVLTVGSSEMARESNIDPLSSIAISGELRGVRWLSERCHLPPADVLPQLAGHLLDQAAKIAVEHCCWWARHPNPKGQFATAARQWPEMTDQELIGTLRRKGYDGFLYFLRAEIIGHFFFQRHGAELHAFSGWVAESYREQKLLAAFSLDFLAYASQCADVVRARVGTGDHPVTHRLLAPLTPHLPELGWDVSADGWVDFRRRGKR